MKLIELETIDSTNTYAKDEATKGTESGTVIFSHEQTNGRGRLGNKWISNKGNLFMSVILRPKVELKDIWQLSFITSLAIYNALKDIVPKTETINLKWPNDVLINSSKISGILLETEGSADWIVVGIGLNVKVAPENSISLSRMAIKNIDAEKMRDLIYAELESLVTKWETDGFEFVRKEWLKHAYKLGKEVKARINNNKVIIGVFKGVDENGSLELKISDGSIKKINSGEVFV